MGCVCNNLQVTPIFNFLPNTFDNDCLDHIFFAFSRTIETQTNPNQQIATDDKKCLDHPSPKQTTTHHLILLTTPTVDNEPSAPNKPNPKHRCKFFFNRKCQKEDTCFFPHQKPLQKKRTRRGTNSKRKN